MIKKKRKRMNNDYNDNPRIKRRKFRNNDVLHILMDQVLTENTQRTEQSPDRKKSVSLFDSLNNLPKANHV